MKSNIIDNLEDKLWVERYRPRTVNDTILPQRIKNFLLKCVEEKDIQHYTAIGNAGSGKTSSAKAMLDEMGADYLTINASETGNIETIRTKIREYASKMSLNPLGFKVVLLDEADGLTPVAQKALRGVIEEFQEGCRFILTANNSNAIVEAIKSRCPVIEFKFINKDERKEMTAQFFARMEEILKSNNVNYDRKELLLFIDRNFPDFRVTITKIQQRIINNSLELNGVGSANDDKIKELCNYLRGTEFTKMRKWVAESMDTDPILIRRAFYDKMYDIVQGDYVPYVVLILNKYDYQENFCSDKELNMVAMFTEMMKELQFK